MNLIELENLVKGAPDEYLTKEVKQPTGKIPPFLALSEIQRRKDMRDRYQAQKNEGPKPTIADQLTGGGIGSLPGAQGAQGAPVPTPSATGVPSAGAPPVATGGAPMPTPPGQPQGFARGGIVKMAEAGVVPLGAEVRSGNPYLDAMSAPQMQYQTEPGGIGDMLAMAGQAVANPPSPATPPVPKYQNKYGMTTAQVKLAQMLSDPASTKMPEAINYDDLIAQAGQSEKDIREQARKDAIGAALVKLGAGLSAGNMGAGFNAAGESVTDIMGKGRTEASAERRLAQQLSLQAREGQRQQAIQEFGLTRDNAMALATMESDTQAKAEERKFRSEQAAAAAADRAAQLQLSRQRGELDQKQFNYGLYISANKLITENAIALTGPRPDKDEIRDYNIKASSYNAITKTDGKGNKIDANGKVVPKPINPEVVWTQDYMGNVAQQAQVIAPEFELDASIFSPTASASPVSNPPKSAGAPTYKIGQVITVGGKRYQVTGGNMNDPDLKELK
jgi:hypothetical protein